MRRSYQFSACLVLAVTFGSMPAWAACVEEKTALPFGNQSVVARGYSCGADKQRQPAVRVTFHRLSSNAASILLDGRRSTTLDRILGQGRLVRNETGTTLANLLGQHGKAKTAGSRSVVGRAGPEGEIGGSGDDEKIVGGKIIELSDVFDFPSITLNAAIRPGHGFPERYAMTYRGPDDPPSATDFGVVGTPSAPRFALDLWTFLTQAEMDSYERERERYNTPEILGRKFEDKAALRKALRDHLLTSSLGREFQYERKLANGRLPDDFALIHGTSSIDACTGNQASVCCWAFTYYPRTTVLDVMTVENISQSPQRLERILGDVVSQGLRPIEDASQARRSDVDMMQPVGIELKPNERAIVPLRIVLLPPPQLQFWLDSSTVLTSREIQSRVAAMPAGNIFQFGKGKRKIEKLKESFRPHNVPAMRTYVYGPEISPTGLQVAGQEITFSRKQAQLGSSYRDEMRRDPIYIDITIEDEAGSCPYLAVWDEADGRWIEHGKVLDKAKGRQLEQTETRTFEGFQGRFMLAEIEPETAYIDRAVLTVALKDGRTIELVPKQKHLAAKDDKYAKLMWGDEIEIRFDLPQGIAAGDVGTSTLAMTGYYDRYSTLTSVQASVKQKPAVAIRQTRP